MYGLGALALRLGAHGALGVEVSAARDLLALTSNSSYIATTRNTAQQHQRSAWDALRTMGCKTRAVHDSGLVSHSLGAGRVEG